MDVIKLIEKYYDPRSKAHFFLFTHSKLVAQKALMVAERVKELAPDFKFIEEAAMLHDIGVFMTTDTKMGCSGQHHYISHGYLGKELLDREGLPAHALVCERHVGVGLTIADIERLELPLPRRDMTPVTLEEKIICFADKFYSKDANLTVEKPIEKIRSQIQYFGPDKIRIFDEWMKLFKEYD